MRKRKRPVVPKLLSDQISEALAAVDDAQANLATALADRAPRLERRRAHARVTHAYDEADALLRQATTLAKPHSYREWSLWRHRLSSLGTARQIHLFAELDDSGLLPIGEVRAIDLGMSGPDIGEFQHGESRPPGTPPTYGLDLDAVLDATDAACSPTADAPQPTFTERADEKVAADPRTIRRTPPPHVVDPTPSAA